MELTKWKNGSVPTFSGLLDEFFTKELNPVGGRLLAKAAPAVNIKETDDRFTLEVAAPGMTKADFNIEVTPDNLLIISSEKKQEREEQKNENGRFTLKEFSFASFSRSFNLPESVDSEQINASYENGLLEITLPKKPEALPKPARVIQID
jgi:HSP20 family protein